MATFMNSLLMSLNGRWRELDLLLDKASEVEANANTELHDVLCRAAVVLIAAHLEGFVRDCMKASYQRHQPFLKFQGVPFDCEANFLQHIHCFPR